MKVECKLLLTALTASLTTLLAMWSLNAAAPQSVVKLENSRVRVSEITSSPGAVRERGIRRADQVIIFMDDCRYERTDPVTGGKTLVARKSGDVIWHNKGEDAPQLTNAGKTAYRTIVVELNQ